MNSFSVWVKSALDPNLLTLVFFREFLLIDVVRRPVRGILQHVLVADLGDYTGEHLDIGLLG